MINKLVFDKLRHTSLRKTQVENKRSKTINLNMNNTLGQKLEVFDISNQPVLHRFTSEKYSSGIYLVSLVVDDKLIES